MCRFSSLHKKLIYWTVVFSFYPHDAAHSLVCAIMQCLSICPSHAAGIVLKQLNLGWQTGFSWQSSPRTLIFNDLVFSNVKMLLKFKGITTSKTDSHSFLLSAVASRRCDLSPERSIFCQPQGIGHRNSHFSADLLSPGGKRSASGTPPIGTPILTFKNCIWLLSDKSIIRMASSCSALSHWSVCLSHWWGNRNS